MHFWNSSIEPQVEKVSKNVIASVDVAGYNPKEIEVYPSGTQYRAFVLLEYSDEEARKIIINRLRKDQMVYSKLKSTNAWKELEGEVNKSKNEDQAQSLSNIEKELNNRILCDKKRLEFKSIILCLYEIALHLLHYISQSYLFKNALINWEISL